MLTISGMKNFYYIPEFTDMRCKAERISEIIRRKFNRDPYNGDVYIFMSKDRRKVKLIHFEDHAYYLHEKSYTNGYHFMRLSFDEEGKRVYKLEWKALVALLQSPVITTMKISA